MNPNNKSPLINILVAGALQLMYLLFESDKGKFMDVEPNSQKGFLLILILLFWVIGIFRPNPDYSTEDSSNNFVVLSVFGTVGNFLIMVGMLCYFGMGNDRNIGIGGFIITILFLIELMAIGLKPRKPELEQSLSINKKSSSRKHKKVLRHKKMMKSLKRHQPKLQRIIPRKKKDKNLRFSNIFITIYSILGLTYIWNITIKSGNFSRSSIGSYIFEMLGAAILFSVVGIPFKRYLILDNMQLKMNKEDRIKNLLSYFILYLSALSPYF